MLEGDRLLRELAEKRHIADKLHRLAIFKELMANKEICPECGCHRANTIEMLGEDCGH